MTVFKKFCSQCHLSNKKNRDECPKSWTDKAQAARMAPEAHCWKMRPEPKPTHAAIVEQARERLRAGDSKPDTIEWLAQQYQALMEEERERIQFERGGHIGHQLPEQLDQQGEKVSMKRAGMPPDLARAAAAGVVNAWLVCPTKLARCEACRAPKCARVPTNEPRAPGKQLSFASGGEE